MRLMGVRQALRQVPPQVGIKTLPAPIGGLVTNENPFLQSTKPVARVLDNMFPTLTGVRPRKGTEKYATVSSAVTSMFAYESGGARKLFAADSSRIFDITSISDPEVAPTADVAGLSSGIWSAQMMETAAGFYLLSCNGTDGPYIYDGSNWAVATLSGPTIADLKAVFTHANRLWFIEKNTLSAWYLAVNSISGSLTEFPLTGVFKEGGELLFGTTMSLDTGAGMDDKALFCTTRGEIAVYAGTDPSDSSLWALEGVYKCAEFLGVNGVYHVGGMPHFLTVEGILPMSAVISKDRAQQSLASVSQAIDDQWRRELPRRTTYDWQVVKWEDENMLFVPTPVGNSNRTKQTFWSNLESGAWCRHISHDFISGATINGNCYMGDENGEIWRMEQTGADGGASYQCKMVMAFHHLDQPGVYKTLTQMRANILTRNDVSLYLYASVDYNVDVAEFPSSIDEFVTDVWDEALWDEALWDGGEGELAGYTTQWQSVGRSGVSFAPMAQMTFGIVGEPNQEIISIDCMYEYGGVGVGI